MLYTSVAMKILREHLRGTFADTCDEVIKALKSDDIGLVVNIHGAESSGRTTIACAAMEESGFPFKKLSLYESSISGWAEMVRKLSKIQHAVLLEYDSLGVSEKIAMQDLVLNGELTGTPRVWIIVSANALGFARRSFFVPPIGLHPPSMLATLDVLIGDFPLTAECAVKSVLAGVCRNMTIGQVAAIVRGAKLAAVGADAPLTCEYVAQAVTQLDMRCAPLLEVCDMCGVFRSIGQMWESGFKSFVGLSEEASDTISRFIGAPDDHNAFLMIEGPVGSGKTHLANLIAKSICSSEKGYVCITSADVLRARIGESEKFLHTALGQSNACVIIEDLEQLFPDDNAESTGSVQRCLPVFISFLDELRFGKQENRGLLVVGTARSLQDVAQRIVEKGEIVKLTNRISIEEKNILIRSQFPEFNPDGSVLGIDLVGLCNRSECIQFGREAKLSQLRTLIADQKKN